MIMDDRVVSYTPTEIQGVNQGVEIKEFSEYQKHNQLLYKQFIRYMRKHHVEDDTELYPYGVVLNTQGFQYFLTMNGIQLTFNKQSDDIDNYVLELISNFERKGWDGFVQLYDIEWLIDGVSNDSDYIRQYKQVSWLSLMLNVIENKDFFEELDTQFSKHFNTKLSITDDDDAGEWITINGIHWFQTKDIDLGVGRYHFFRQLFNFIRKNKQVTQSVQEIKSNDTQHTTQVATVKYEKAIVGVRQGKVTFTNLDKINWQDGYDEFRQELVDGVVELGNEYGILNMVLGFEVNKRFANITYTKEDKDDSIIIADSLDQYDLYSESNKEPQFVGEDDLEDILEHVRKIFND